LKYRNLYLLETSGPVQACNGIALPSPRLEVDDDDYNNNNNNNNNFLYINLH
jgi:hypothetical protein